MELAAEADAASVQMLQSRAPRVSNHDLHFLEKRMNDGTLFPSIQDGTKRNAVWDRLQTINVPIPTLQTFFSDLRYLAVARKVMRTLLQINNPKTKMSIDERLGGQHRMIGRLRLGQSRGVVRQGLRELWRFSFQYGLEMTGTARCQPRDHRTQEAAAVIPNMTASVDRTRLWQHFFWLADHEGFSTPSVGDFGASPMDPPMVPTPANSPELWGEDEPVSRRRGVPYVHTVNADRSALSKEALEQTLDVRSVTPTLIRQAQFRAFFRHLGEDALRSPTINHPESRASMTPVDMFVSDPTVPLNTAEDTAEHPGTSPIFRPDVFHIADLDNTQFDSFWNAGMNMGSNVPPLGKLRVHVRAPYCPERTIDVPGNRERVIEFLDGLLACGFVLDIAHFRKAKSADIYEWHTGNPFDEVHATLTQDIVCQYDVPPENRMKRRRRDLDPSIVKDTVDEVMAWINRQVQLSIVEEEI
jgi:hypothetical protein